MKKMMMVLMMAVTMMAGLFAKPVTLNVKLGGESCLLVTDDENKPTVLGDLSDVDIVKIFRSRVPEKLGDNEKLIYCGFLFNDELNEPAKKYYTYLLFKDLSPDGYKSLYVDINLGDGRMLRLVYLIERNNEYGGINPYSIEE